SIREMSFGIDAGDGGDHLVALSLQSALQTSQQLAFVLNNQEPDHESPPVVDYRGSICPAEVNGGLNRFKGPAAAPGSCLMFTTTAMVATTTMTGCRSAKTIGFMQAIMPQKCPVG